MSKTICLTYYYSEFYGTDQFLKSCKEVGIEVYNAWPQDAVFVGHHDHTKTIQYLYEALKKLKADSWEKVIYADAADSYFVRFFEPPDGKLIYSAEKAYYPACEGNFRHRYPTGGVEFPNSVDQWRFLNGGGWCAPIDLAIEIWEKTNFIGNEGKINGQHEAHKMYWDAVDLGIPIQLDTECQYFQTGAFEHEGDFQVTTTWNAGEFGKPQVQNVHTGTTPCLWHFNGRTDAKWFYDLYK